MHKDLACLQDPLQKDFKHAAVALWLCQNGMKPSWLVVSILDMYIKYICHWDNAPLTKELEIGWKYR